MSRERDAGGGCGDDRARRAAIRHKFYPVFTLPFACYLVGALLGGMFTHAAGLALLWQLPVGFGMGLFAMVIYFGVTHILARHG